MRKGTDHYEYYITDLLMGRFSKKHEKAERKRRRMQAMNSNFALDGLAGEDNTARIYVENRFSQGLLGKYIDVSDHADHETD